MPAVDRTAPFASEKRYLLRETHAGNGWLSPAVHGTLALVCLVWALAFVTAVRDLGADGDDGRRRLSPRRLAGRRSAAAAAT